MERGSVLKGPWNRQKNIFIALGLVALLAVWTIGGKSEVSRPPPPLLLFKCPYHRHAAAALCPEREVIATDEPTAATHRPQQLKVAMGLVLLTSVASVASHASHASLANLTRPQEG